jgi:histidinol-phosphate phosphatase family protein
MKGDTRPCLFLDRDGVVNEGVGMITTPNQMQLYPFAAEAIRRMRELGYAIAVISNQPAVAMGLCEEVDLNAIHHEMRRQLAADGAAVDFVDACTHHPEYSGLCDCRKPGTGMIHRAVRELGVNMAQSWLIGDETSDILTGHRAGLRTILVETGKAGGDRLYAAAPDLIEENLLTAVQGIIGAMAAGEAVSYQ